MTESHFPKATDNSQAGDGDGLLTLLVSLLQHRLLLFAVPSVLFVLVVGVGLLSHRTYTAYLSFIPQAGASSLGQIASLAAQFGVRVPGGARAASADFYADLVRSGEILRAVVRVNYTVGESDDRRQGTLIDFFEIDEATEGLRTAKAAKRLQQRMSVRTDPKTSVVKISVRAGHPELAKQIAEAILAEVHRFDLNKRQTQAGEERRFIEERLAEARDSLRAAEDVLATFLETNRGFRNSPQLVFQHDRLQRVVIMEQQVVTSLNQGYQQAQIDEVRNTPVVTVIEMPILPPRADSRLLLVKGVLALLVGLALAVMAVILARFAGALKAEDPDTAEAFREAFAGVRRDVIRPWRLLRRPRPSKI